jgi:hypothetical protein
MDISYSLTHHPHPHYLPVVQHIFCPSLNSIQWESENIFLIKSLPTTNDMFYNTVPGGTRNVHI